MPGSYKLEAGDILTVTAVRGNTTVRQIEDSTVTDLITLAASKSYGPYLLPRNFSVGNNGDASFATSPLAKSLGRLLLVNAGAPVNAAQATLAVDPAGNNNSLTYTAVAYGDDGNNIRITYVDPAANSQSLAVSVAGNAIVVSLATNSGGTITTIASAIATAIAASTAAAALVTVANTAANDGTGAVTAMAKASMTGGAGTGIGSLPSAMLFDTTNADLYRNDGTAAAPVWVKIGDAA